MVELKVDGYFDAQFINPETGEEVSEKKEKEILAKLDSGEYVFGIVTRSVKALSDLSEVLYEVILEPTDALEYDWDEV